MYTRNNSPYTELTILVYVCYIGQIACIDRVINSHLYHVDHDELMVTHDQALVSNKVVSNQVFVEFVLWFKMSLRNE